MCSLKGDWDDVANLAGHLGMSVEQMTWSAVVDAVRTLTDSLGDTQHALTKAHGERMYAAMHPPAATVTEDEAARLILSKCTPDTLDRFGIARETAPAGSSDANIIVALLTMLCNTNEQHTGDYESINQAAVSMRVGQSVTRTAAPSPQLPAFGREPRNCKTCGAVFTPAKQGQLYGCNACGEYTNYLRIVERDRQDYDPTRVADAFDLFCLKKSIRCTCAGAQAHPRLQSPVTGDVRLTRPRRVVNDRGEEMIVDEVVELPIVTRQEVGR